MDMKQGPRFFYRFCREHPLSFIVILGILLRLPFIFLSPVHGDEGMYMYDAQLILKGSTPFEDFHTRSPVFLYSLALFMLLFGENVVVARIFSLVVFVATTLVVYRLGKDLHSRRSGLLAAGVFSFSPFAVTWSIVVETEIYLVFFVSLAALVLAKAEKERAVSKQRSRALLLFALSGLLLGVSVFTRRSGLVLLPAFLFFIYLAESFFVGSKEKRQPLVSLVQHGVALLAGFILAFLVFFLFILFLTDWNYFVDTFFSSAGVWSCQAKRVPVLQGLVEHACICSSRSLSMLISSSGPGSPRISGCSPMFSVSLPLPL